MERDKNILFFGELASGEIHGVSISNSININILSGNYSIHIVEENCVFDTQPFSNARKIFRLSVNWLSIMVKCIKIRFEYFYLSLSLSLTGVFKILVMMTIFKILRPGGKIILHIHRGDLSIAFSKNALNRFLIRNIIRLCNKAIILSESFVIPELKRHVEFVIIPNTVLVPIDTNKIRSSRKNNLLFVSNYLRDKGILDLLEVMRTFNGNRIELETFGQFAEKETAKFISAYKSDNVRINGPVTSEKEKFKIISSSRCLVLPSYNEGQPLIILEAMAAGTPVIATKVGDIENMVGTNYPFLIRPGNKNELKSVILDIYSLDDVKYQIISERLSNRFNELFSYEKHKRQLLDAFK